MADINSCTFTGRLTRDSELKYTQGGLAIARFSIAVNRRAQQNGEWKDIASFLDFFMIGKGAESLNPYLTKGRNIAVNAEARQNTYTDTKSGETKSRIEFFALSVNIQNGDGYARPNNAQDSAPKQKKYNGNPTPSPDCSEPDDGIPF